jgi:HAD superfamily hydrolase (TIGR01509 family)
MKTRSQNGALHDKSVRNSSFPPPFLRRLRHRIHLQPVGTMLVQRGGFSHADAAGWQRLPVSGLPAQDSRARRRLSRDVTASWDVHAVLLDMDGTLVDTERVYFDSMVGTLCAFGYTDDVEVLCHAMIGLPGPGRDSMLRTRYGAGFPLFEIKKAYAVRRDEAFAAGLPLKAGAVELLDALQGAQCPMAIVTSSSRQTSDSRLKLAGIRDRFEMILTREDVAQSKPSPELYLLAASRLGVGPEFCLAVEDSDHGVASAHAAGAITIMVPDMLPPTDESRARCVAVLDDLNAVLEMLRQRGGIKRRP